MSKKKKTSHIAILSNCCQAIQIKKRLDRLRGINTSFSNNNSTNKNNNNNNSNLFGLTPGDEPPSLPTIEDFLGHGPRPPQPPPPPPASTPFNLFGSNAPLFPPPTNDFNVNASVRDPPPNISTRGIGSQAASSIRENKAKTQQEVDDFLYELSETMPDLVLGDELTNALGTDAQNIFDQNASSTKKEEEDEILKDFMEEYEIEKIGDTMDETAQVPESFFFYGGESERFVNALEFIGRSPINREFSAFLISDFGRKTMTQNKLSIYVESGDIFYDNHNTGENFYNF